jgi:cyclophilin family peptidyl-prolyl cis-trans isomerase
VSKAAKRERQRQNREARREYEEALEKRRRFWRSARTFGLLLIPIVAIFAFLALRSNGDDDKTSSSSDKKTTATTLAAPSGVTIDPTKTYTATVETSQGTFTIGLDAANAPNSVNNFVYLAKAGYFDGRDVFRVNPDIFQTGDPEDSGIGDPGYTIQAELPSAYTLGSVAWAKKPTEAAGTAGSQWFAISTESYAAKLPKEYGIIGTVTDGIDVVKKITALAPQSGDGAPTTKVTMQKVTINES